MRIYLDSKDLINVVEHANPLSLAELGERLNRHAAKLVLSFSGITELVAPLADNGDTLKVRQWLNDLESVTPHYLAESSIQVKELRSAIDAYNTKTEYTAIDPYVRRFDFTLRSVAKPDIVNYRLSNIVLHIWRHQHDWFEIPIKIRKNAASHPWRRSADSKLATKSETRGPLWKCYQPLYGAGRHSNSGRPKE